MEECEKEGDGLYWLWEIAEEVGPGWCRGTERKWFHDWTLYLIMEHLWVDVNCGWSSSWSVCNHSFLVCRLSSLGVSVRADHCSKNYRKGRKPFPCRRTQVPRFYRNVQQTAVRIECMVECKLFETLLVFGEMPPPYITEFCPQPKCIA